MNVVFFGTHIFGATILEGLHTHPNICVTAVVTQPDRPVGRKQELQASPVKQKAVALGIPVFQPKSLKTFDTTTIPADLYVVAQYGLLIPEHVLNATQHGTINVHTSLLPKYRGASPIQSAIANGDSHTGVTIMLMDKGLDTGPILAQQETTIEPNKLFLELDAKLAQIAVPLLNTTLFDFTNGLLQPQHQNNAAATECSKLSREDGKLDFSLSAQTLYNTYRAYTPWPGVWTVLDGKRIKLLEMLLTDEHIETGKLVIKDDTLYIGCATGALQITKLQLEGKPPMMATDFVHGYAKFNNSIVG